MSGRGRLICALAAGLVAMGAGCRRPAGEPDLSALVDALLPRIEVLSGLEARRPVHTARRDVASVRRYVAAQLEKEMPPEELAGVQADRKSTRLNSSHVKITYAV